MTKRRSDASSSGKIQTSDGPTDTGRSRSNRRRLIQTLALGGGIASAKLVPNTWATPAVQSVLLPAHASGSTCTLGNLEPPELTLQRNPAGSESLVENIADTLIPRAWADSPVFLTGCYRIEFICNTNKGTLCISIATLTGDEPDLDEICVDFEAGVCMSEEDLWFRVEINDNESATLLLGGPGCSDTMAIDLVPNPKCEPRTSVT